MNNKRKTAVPAAGKRQNRTGGRGAAEGKRGRGEAAFSSGKETIDFQELPYEKQLEEKQRRMEQLLGRFGKVEPILGMEDPLRYRNKVHAVFGRDGRGRIVCGEYKPGTHRIVEKKDSPIEDAKCREIIQTIKRMVIKYRIHVYDEDLRTGLLRHVVVRRAFQSGEIMVVLVCASAVFPSANHFVKELREAHPEITTVVLNVNDRKTSAVMGDREKTLYGKGFITDTLCGCTFRISADSFWQVNSVQCEALYGTAIAYAGLREGDTAMDAYCGTGTIGIIAAKMAGGAVVTGVERNKAAVSDAKINAKNNKVENIRFVAADASDYMERLAAQKDSAGRKSSGKENGRSEEPPFRVLFMDPPRSGSDERFLAAACALAPEKIVYISCGPEALARDLEYLRNKKYRVKKIHPVDMFPFTAETECVCLLERG